MEVQLIKLNKIKVNDKNPRTITEDKLRRLVESILVFPKMLMIRPVVIDDKGVALGGNMRTRALKEIKKLGRDGLQARLQQIRQFNNKPVEEQNEIISHWEAWFKSDTVPVLYADTLTEEEKREFIIKDNSSFGAWDWDVLANEWESEQLDDWGVDVWQIDETETEFDGTTDSQPTEQKQAEEDDFDPDEVHETKVKTGDVWQLGEHRLMCGDSLNEADVLKLLNGEHAPLTFTDPPYKIGEAGGGIVGASNSMSQIKTNKVDEFDPSKLKLYSETNIYSHNKPLIKDYILLAEREGKPYDLAIYKKQGLPNYKGHLITDLEYIAIIGNQDPKKGLDFETYSKLYVGKKDADNELSYSKPVALCGKFIMLYSDKGDIVLDIFGGSGTTMIACEQLGRKCRMMELDPHYCTVIIARWEKLTGQKAIKLNP